MKDDQREKRLLFVQFIAKDIKRKVAIIAMCKMARKEYSLSSIYITESFHLQIYNKFAMNYMTITIDQYVLL